jgi:hypothetical protein
MTIHRLIPTIDVHTPLGYGKCIAWICFSEDVNEIWKVQMYADGAVRNFWDDQVVVYPNEMNGEKMVIPKGWKK